MVSSQRVMQSGSVMTYYDDRRLRINHNRRIFQRLLSFHKHFYAFSSLSAVRSI